MNKDLKYLDTQLPEDIAKLKAVGEYDRVERIIDKRLEKDLPVALRKRLEQEKEILPIIRDSYPHTYEAALSLFKDNIADFKTEEFESLRDEDALDWVYLDSEIHFRENILQNIMKTRPNYAKRCTNPELLDKRTNLLNETMHKMKEKGELTYHIRLRATLKVKPEAQKPGEKIRVHLPLPIEYAQVKNFRLIDTSHKSALVNEPDHPARTVYFEKEYEADEEFYVEYEFDNHMVYKNPLPEEVDEAQPTFYTEEQLPHIKFSPYIKSVAKEIIGNETNPLEKARLIYEYITKNVMYSFVRPYYTITDIPTYALTGFKGDCGIQALTFITLCRAVGVPARWQAGLYTNPETIGNHDWAQFYVAPFGWLYADTSFGGSAYRTGEEERWKFYFGNLEPFRMPAVSDFQHDFTPALDFSRNDPYDNQNGEAEFESGKLTYNDIETTEVAIEIYEKED